MTEKHSWEGAEWDPKVSGWKIKEAGDEVVYVVPMVFNNRIIIGDIDDKTGYSHGWCYDKGLVAFLAADLWDPLTQDEPAGYKKRATPGFRCAPNG